MSVRTTADECKDSAIENIGKAIDNLTDIIERKCWGHNEYLDEYYAIMVKSLDKLRKIKRKLDW